MIHLPDQHPDVFHDVNTLRYLYNLKKSHAGDQLVRMAYQHQLTFP